MSAEQTQTQPQTHAATRTTTNSAVNAPANASNANANANDAAPPPQRNDLKRKTPPMASLEDHANANADAASTANAQVDRKPLILPPGASIPPGVHEGGAEGGAERVICEACGCGVALREEGGGFTTRYWEAHRASCGGAQPQHAQHPSHHHPHHPTQLVYAPAHAAAYPSAASHSTSTSIAEGPPAKRRRAKRTEEERIEYLRADAHVAQFEAYRVLCASCDKWIRLRPNSTYCSIPWDAHRKSCLAKKSPSVLPSSPPLPFFLFEELITTMLTTFYVSPLYLAPLTSNLRPPAPQTLAPPHHAVAASSNAKNVYALEERNAMFTKDPDVRKFDSERILCGMCDKWLSTPTDDHLGAVQVWVQHRAACQKTVNALKNVIYSASASASASANLISMDTEERKPVISSPTGNASAGPSHRALQPASPTARPPHPHSAPSASWPAHPTPIPDANANANAAPPPPPRTPTHLPLPDAPHLLLDLSPANYAAPHESRRRNAEQRAATLRADVLIREVEPNRVFCSLCTKWVQLRQDSSYCAYPWLQHRGKCLARYQRRAQKASEVASSAKGRRPTAGAHTEHRASEDGDEPESEEVLGADPAKRHLLLQGHHQGQHQRGARPPQQHPPRAIPAGYAAARPMKEWAAAQREREREQQMQMQQRDREQQGQGQGQQGDGDLDAEGEADDVDADGDSYMEDDVGGGGGGYAGNGGGYNSNNTHGHGHGHAHGHGHGHGHNGAIGRRGVPASLADLDSQGGRRAFIFASVDYLFRTTYESSDDMSVSALLTYLNAAMPTDKHEDFDTGEVVRGVSALASPAREQGRAPGRYVLEGDMLRMLHESG
ncbi:hypothetical protein C8F04DRAFT_1237980 [Mycena alexandri]|uniref:Uncharacterized protein n=1 Tax=Mycena alexandri TaxID=1745969 RepID=A0AAD6WUF2_9AGAR|nr:hypothetical protein C8F04DRAFT_1237980 [Mycena alexandri]